jgi:hypothetical protein
MKAAFPYKGCNICMGDEGMSLRDYFAAAALPSVIAIAVELALSGATTRTERDWAKQAYSMADAMLLEREKLQSGIK